MSNDDPTRRVDEESPPTPPTQPTIDTVLGRIEELGARLEQKIEQSEERLSSRIEKLEQGLGNLQQETHKNFRSLERWLEVISGDMTKLRADMRDLESRIYPLETKPA
jgi:chromosome segregation ATPase